MGEYAIRKADRTEIKIGTCENMYYLRFEDRHKVQALPGNVDPVRDAGLLRFRLPFPDEDDMLPGEYEDYNRGLRLHRTVKGHMGHDYCEDFTDPETASEPGTIQLRHESGLLLNVPCYHGEKLPEVAAPMQAFWNGKSWSLELVRLRAVGEGGELRVYPVVECRHCRQAWRYKWSDIWEYIPDVKLRDRLAVYAGEAVLA
jgi:hypothetical protein